MKKKKFLYIFDFTDSPTPNLSSINWFWDVFIWPVITLIVAGLMLVIGIPAMLIRGFVFMKLWNWFVVGTVTGINMTWIVASGIALMVSFLTAHTIGVKDERTPKEKYTAAGMEFIAPLFILFFGWILTLFL